MKFLKTKNLHAWDMKVSIAVRMKGLEPPRREALDPKSSAATNYATSALWTAKLEQYF